MPLVIVRLEWVRSAEPPSVMGIAALMTPSAISEALRVARRRPWRRGPPCNRPCAAKIRRNVAREVAREAFALGLRGEPRFPHRAARSRAPAGGAPGGEAVLGDLEGRLGPVRDCRAPLRFPRRRAARRGSSGALLVGRAEADGGAAGDEGRPRRCLAPRRARLSTARIVAVDRRSVPARGLEARELVHAGGERGRPSMVMRLSSHSTISRLSFRWPARSIASWLTPSIRQPSPAMT